MARVTRISRQSDIAGLLSYIMSQAFGFEELGLAYFRDEALQQMLDFENQVSLPDALRQAVNSLLHDTQEGSFGAVLPGYTDEAAKDFIEGGRLTLLPGDMASEPTFASFPSPLRGESLADNWIFGLELFDLSDDIFWAIVPRDGKQAAYNYIGAPMSRNTGPESRTRPISV